MVIEATSAHPFGVFKDNLQIKSKVANQRCSETAGLETTLENIQTRIRFVLPANLLKAISISDLLPGFFLSF